MASGDRTIAFTEEQLEDLSETFETVLEKRKMNPSNLERIPIEILEKILLDVPTFELPLNEPWVCKSLTTVIYTPQFWVKKLKNIGFSIENKIWDVLKKFKDNETVSCLYFASLYQEHCMKQTPITQFILDVLKPGKSGKLFITDELDDAMIMASAVLVCREINNQITICVEENENVPGLSLLLMLCEARKICLFLQDLYGFWNFHPRMDYFRFLKDTGGKTKVWGHFIGCVTTSVGFPIDDVEPRVAITGNDQYAAIDPGFSNLSKSSDMWLHLKAGTNISDLPKFSSNHKNITLIVSEMEESHILWMIELAQKFSKIRLLSFLKYQLNFESTTYLLKDLAKSDLETDEGIWIWSQTMGRKSKELLREVASNLWIHQRCHPLRFRRVSYYLE